MHEFADSFQTELERITESIQHSEQSHLSAIQSDINQLSDRVRDASTDIPAHDRKVYGERIKGLQQSLKDRQTAIAPKKKFKFASKGSGFAKKNEEPVIDAAPTNGTSKASHNLTAVISTSVTFENLNGTRIDFESESEHGTRPCNLFNLSSCIADMRDQRSNKATSFASLTVKDIDNSIIVCDHVNGPVHLTGIRNSIIVVSAQQFRMHKSHSCHIYLQTPSRPIIEDCSGIQFAALPGFLRTSSDKQTENQVTQVDDFNWHRAEPSPNWNFLDSVEIIESDRWQTILTDKNITAKDVFKGVKSDVAASTE